jgi:hypothetical protein
MTQTQRYRKPSVHHREGGSVRPSPKTRPGKTGKKRRLSRGDRLLLLAMTYGSAVALLLVTVGFTSLVRHGGTPQGTPQQQAAGTTNHNHAAHSSGPQPNIQIQTRHLGNLVLDIKAEVTMNQDRDSLMKAKVVAFTDMVQMPNAHSKGPLPLQEAPGKPGLYETTTQLPMPGDYKIRVVVENPVQGEQTTTVPVNTTNEG